MMPTKNQLPLVLVSGLVLTIGVALFFIRQRQPLIPELTPSSRPSTLTGQVTLEGKSVCLPHKNTDGPQTMECAFGIQTDDGKYYALDTQSIDFEAVGAAQTAERMQVEGHLVPIEAISSDRWQKYNVQGIIQVQSMSAL